MKTRYRNQQQPVEDYKHNTSCKNWIIYRLLWCDICPKLTWMFIKGLLIVLHFLENTSAILQKNCDYNLTWCQELVYVAVMSLSLSYLYTFEMLI